MNSNAKHSKCSPWRSHVNTLIITRAKTYTKFSAIAVVMMSIASMAQAEWTVDFSRRARAVREADLSQAAGTTDFGYADRTPASVQAPTVTATTPAEDIGRKE